MNREEAPGKSPEDMYIQQKVRVLLMLKKMGSNVSTPSLHMSLDDVILKICPYETFPTWPSRPETIIIMSKCLCHW